MKNTLPRHVLLARIERGYHAGSLTDGHRLILAIESGGMAGAISAAMVAAFNEAGINVFDEIRGTSAGAMNAAYFAAGQASQGATIYPRFLCDGRFINPRRIFTPKPVMDLDFLVVHVFAHDVPLDAGALRASKVPIYAAATTRGGDPVMLPLHQTSPDTLRSRLKASARMPFVAEGWTTHPHIDGTFTRPLPITHQENSNSLFIVLRNFPTSHNPYAPPVSPGRFLAQAALLISGTRLNKPAPPNHILSSNRATFLSPPQPIPSHTQDPRILWNAMRTAYRQAAAFIGHPHLQFPEAWESHSR